MSLKPHHSLHFLQTLNYKYLTFRLLKAKLCPVSANTFKNMSAEEISAQIKISRGHPRSSYASLCFCNLQLTVWNVRPEWVFESIVSIHVLFCPRLHSLILCFGCFWQLCCNHFVFLLLLDTHGITQREQIIKCDTKCSVFQTSVYWEQ